MNVYNVNPQIQTNWAGVCSDFASSDLPKIFENTVETYKYAP